MKISVAWLNEYLEPGDITAQDAERVLTFAGFPIESAHATPDGDTCMDVEVTSNRGDVLSHIGVAREIAAATGRRLRAPAANRAFNWFGEADLAAPGGGTGGTDVGSLIAIDNRAGDKCPLFTARVVRGVKVGPSPKWLVRALESVGQRSINNVVDLTNFISLEYGQPTHVFDLATLAVGADGKVRLGVAPAAKGEKLALLDGRTVTLIGDEIVVADGVDGGGRAISLAGIMGGSETGVTERTTDVVIEAATWDPVSVRTIARRLGIRTDASYRYERIVDARTIETPARRLAAMIVKLAGGKLLPGVIHAPGAGGAAGAGGTERGLAQVSLRPARCRAMIGLDVSTPEIQRVLEAHELQVRPEGSGADLRLACTIPAHRPDLEREIDLVEEVARTVGLDKIPVHEKIGVRVTGPQTSERAVQAVHQALTGLGFFETVTFTFVSPKAAKAFTPAGLETLMVHDERRKADPVLRPSVLPSLLACRKKNQDGGVKSDGELAGVGPGGVRLYEVSAVFAQEPARAKGERGVGRESVKLALLADAGFPAGARGLEQKQAGVRALRGAIEAVAVALGGSAARVALAPGAAPGFDPGACAIVTLDGATIGAMGVIAAAAMGEYGLEMPVVGAELEMSALCAMFPPRANVRALPQMPGIERDLSLIVREDTRWSAIDELVGGAAVPLLEAWGFVGVYRGPQVGASRKSVTLRLRFRDDSRTLTHEEVSPQVESLVALARARLGAELRTA